MDAHDGDGSRQRDQDIERPRALTVLGYHKIGAPAPGGWETWFYIPEAIFEQQLTVLCQAGCTVVDVATLLRAVNDPGAIPEHAVLLTFDDGCRSMHDVALPILRRFGYSAALFVPSEYVGGYTADFDADEPNESLCSWDELRALSQHGVSIQSHSATHRHFSRLTAVERLDELVRSKAMLEDGVGTSVEVVAYPYGDCGPDRAELDAALRAAGYRAGCVYGAIHGPGPNHLPFGDPFRLKRVAMGSETDLRMALLHRPGEPTAGA